MIKNIKNILKKPAALAINKVIELLMIRSKGYGGRRLFDSKELKLVYEALVSQNLFGMDGRMVANFEKEFALGYGVPYAVASTSGTAAIHTALGALDLNAGDEVITAPITDLGTIIPILYQNCIPVFADIDNTYQMDPVDIERKITPRTKAIIAVHLFGNTCDMDALNAVAKKHGIPLIEDCSQAHMTQYKGRFAGTIGDIGCFSFQQSKHMTTGDGGMTVTSNKRYYERMKLFVDKGYARKGWGTRAYLFHAPNYRMNELTAAVGRAQLEKVKTVVEKRSAMGIAMTKLLTGIEGLTPAPVTPGTNHSYWLYPFKLEGVDLEIFCKEMIKRGVYAMAGYTGKTIYLCTESLSAKKTYGDSELPFSWRKDKNFEYKEGLCPKAEAVLKTLVCVPWHEGWGMEGVEKAARTVKECLTSLRGEKHANPPPPTPLLIKEGGRGGGRIRIALIGCGQIGRWHLDAYKKNSAVEIAVFVDTDIDRAKKFAREVNAKAYASYQEMLKNEKLAGASLCTLPSTHRDIAIGLLNAGVHVLCEKPLAISVKQAEEMLAKAREKNLLLLTAFKLRFSEEVAKAKEILEKGSLGRILNFRLLFGGYMDMSGSWHVKKELSGGGVIMDNGPHAADLIQYLFGKIRNISGQVWDIQSVGVEDMAKLELTLESGVAGTLDLSWPAWVTPNAYLEVYGDEGALFIDTAGISYKFKTWSEWKRIPNREGIEAGFARQIDHFVDSIGSSRSTVTDAKDGLEVQKILEAAYRAVEKGERISL